MNPGDRNAQLYLARSLLQLDEYKAAVKLLEDLQRDAPRDPQVLYSLGVAHINLAAMALGELQKTSPDSYLVEVLLGKAAEEKQAFMEAFDHYKKAIEKAPPRTPGLHYDLGNAKWKSGEFSQALDEFQRELQINPFDYRALWKAALIILPNNPQEVLRMASRALELQPDLSSALMIRGRALLALKEPARAVDDFKKAAALDPEDDTVHFQLARAYRELGMMEEAETEAAIFQRMQQESRKAGGKAADLPAVRLLSVPSNWVCDYGLCVFSTCETNLARA